MENNDDLVFNTDDSSLLFKTASNKPIQISTKSINKGKRFVEGINAEKDQPITKAGPPGFKLTTTNIISTSIKALNLAKVQMDIAASLHEETTIADELTNFDEYAQALIDDDKNDEIGGWPLLHTKNEEVKHQNEEKVNLQVDSYQVSRESEQNPTVSCNSSVLNQEIPSRESMDFPTARDEMNPEKKVSNKRKWAAPKQIVRVVEKPLPKLSEFGPSSRICSTFTDDKSKPGSSKVQPLAAESIQVQNKVLKAQALPSPETKIRVESNDDEDETNSLEMEFMDPSPPMTKIKRTPNPVSKTDKDRLKTQETIAKLNISEFTVWLSDPTNRHPLHQPTLESEFILSSLMGKPQIRSLVHKRIQILMSNTYLVKTQDIRYFYLDILDVLKKALLEELETTKTNYYSTLNMLDHIN